MFWESVLVGHLWGSLVLTDSWPTDPSLVGPHLVFAGLVLQQRGRLLQGEQQGGAVVEGRLPGSGDVIEVLPVPLLPCFCREGRRPSQRLITRQ